MKDLSDQECRGR